MFTSGDVLFPEIFEITLGSEKGKHLVPQEGVVSGLNRGRRWKGKVEFMSNALLSCSLDRVIFRQSDLYRSWNISQISLRGVVEKSFELKVVWKVVCNVDAVLCNGKKVWTLPREPAEQGKPVCYIADVNLVRMRSEWEKFVSSKSAKISVFQRLHKSSICSPTVNVGVSLRSLDGSGIVSVTGSAGFMRPGRQIGPQLKLFLLFLHLARHTRRVSYSPLLFHREEQPR